MFAPKVPYGCHEVTHNIAKKAHYKKGETRMHSSVHQYCISASFVLKFSACENTTKCQKKRKRHFM